MNVFGNWRYDFNVYYFLEKVLFLFFDIFFYEMFIVFLLKIGLFYINFFDIEI